MNKVDVRINDYKAKTNSAKQEFNCKTHLIFIGFF